MDAVSPKPNSAGGGIDVDELTAHLAQCPDCTPDSIDENGYAELGTYCPVAVEIIYRQA